MRLAGLLILVALVVGAVILIPAFQSSPSSSLLERESEPYIKMARGIIQQARTRTNRWPTSPDDPSLTRQEHDRLQALAVGFHLEASTQASARYTFKRGNFQKTHRLAWLRP